MNSKPNYKLIYHDLIKVHFPEKMVDCEIILSNDNLSSLDILALNNILFPDKKSKKFKTYDKESIKQILDFQKKHQLNDSQLARHFGLSRNTISSWKKKIIMRSCDAEN